MAKRRVEAARAALAAAEADLREARRRRRIGCSCGKSHAIGRLALVVTHFHVEPHGCTGGDYWKEGEWRFVCPATGVENRLLFFGDYRIKYEDRDRVGVAAEPTFKSLYRHLFASREDVHRGEDRADTHNNLYVDEHRAAFELPPVPNGKAI